MTNIFYTIKNTLFRQINLRNVAIRGYDLTDNKKKKKKVVLLLFPGIFSSDTEMQEFKLICVEDFRVENRYSIIDPTTQYEKTKMFPIIEKCFFLVFV